MTGDLELPDDHIMIPVTLYEGYLRASRKLAALKSAGVDNWEGYDYAMELLGDQE